MARGQSREERERAWVERNGPMTSEDVEIFAHQVLEDEEKEGALRPHLLNALDLGSDGRVRARVQELRAEREHKASTKPKGLLSKLTKTLTKAGGKRKGAGRPKVPAKEKKDQRVHFGLTGAEFKQFADAKEPGEKDAETARRLVLWALENMPGDGDT